MKARTDCRPSRALRCSLRQALPMADGELNIFNWGNYTSPDLIKKFEDALQGQGDRHRL